MLGAQAYVQPHSSGAGEGAEKSHRHTCYQGQAKCSRATVRWLRRRNGPPRGSENFTNFHFFHPQKRCGSLDGVSFLTNNYIYYQCWVRRRMSSPTALAQEFISKRVLKIPIDTHVMALAQWVICPCPVGNLRACCLPWMW